MATTEAAAISLAREIAKEPEPAAGATSDRTQAQTKANLTLTNGFARQGDLVLCHEPSLDSTGYQDDERANASDPIVMATGRHGAHVMLCAPGTTYTAGHARPIDPANDRPAELRAIHLTGPAVIIHTDRPDGRHRAITVSPGRLSWWIQRELSTDDLVVEVAD